MWESHNGVFKMLKNDGILKGGFIGGLVLDFSPIGGLSMLQVSSKLASSCGKSPFFIGRSSTNRSCSIAVAILVYWTLSHINLYTYLSIYIYIHKDEQILFQMG